MVREVLQNHYGEVVEVNGQIAARDVNYVTIHNVQVKNIGKVDHIRIYDNEVVEGIEILKDIKRQEVVTLTGKIKIYRRKSKTKDYALTEIKNIRKGY